MVPMSSLYIKRILLQPLFCNTASTAPPLTLNPLTQVYLDMAHDLGQKYLS